MLFSANCLYDFPYITHQSIQRGASNTDSAIQPVQAIHCEALIIYVAMLCSY